MTTPPSTGSASHPTSVSLPSGLSSDEASRRLKKFGPNAMPDTNVHPLRMALEKFWAPVPWMLEAAIVLELALGKYIEAAIIGGLLIFNAALGLFQESRAQATLTALKSRLALNASVRRDGAWKTVPAAELVPGDVVKLSLGGVVAADVHITGGEVLLDQSMLTGESVPIEAAAGVQTFAGALVRRGEAVAEVTATGARTKFGRTAELVRTAHVVSSQQKAVLRVVRNLAIFNGVVIAILVAYAYFLKMPFAEIIPLVLTAVLASIPVALPATFTLAAALGARALAKLGVLPTRLSAVDEAGTTDVLCADKTGTLTQNALTVTSVRAMPGFDEPHVLALAALASSDGGQDPVDGAIRAAAARKSISDAPKLVRFEPFDPAKKMSEATATDSTGSAQRIVKGAFAAVIGLAEPSPAGAALAKELEGKGFRVLAVAVGPANTLKLAGLIALSDPPRADSAELVTELHGLGVRTVMVTGDAPATAAIVARAVGLDGAVCPPGPIPDNVQPEQFAVFAGVLPEDKYKLVKAFQKGGHTVGMCGDGANDAPALRQAQIGIAVSTATDVAKSAAGMVLTEAGLAGIVAAVKEGRITFQRIQTYTLNAIIKKIVTVLFLIVGLIMTGQAILTPLLMVIVMVTGDFLSMSLTTDNVRPSPTPNSWRIGSLTMAGVVMGAGLLAFCTGVLAIGRFRMNLGIDSVRTLAFVALVFGSQATIYAIRERRHLWGTRPSLLLGASSIADIAIASTLAVGGIAMTALPVLLVAGTLAAAAAFAFVLDFVKVPVFARLGISQSRQDPPATHETPGIAKTEGAPIVEPNVAKPSASDSKPEAKGAPEPTAHAEPQPEAEAQPKPQAEPKPDAKASVAAMLNTSLGELLVAGPSSKTRRMPGASSPRLSARGVARAQRGLKPTPGARPIPVPTLSQLAKPRHRRTRRRRPRTNPTYEMSGKSAGTKAMKIHTKAFRVEEGAAVDLEKWPTKVDPVYKSKTQYKNLLEDHVARLSSQQQLLYASNRYAVLLIFQATDAAGKDGAIRHVMSGVNPQGCQVFSFKHPSAAELEHDFLWRTTRDLPARGRIGIFNRSYYEEVLIIRVHPELLSGEALVDPPSDDKTFWHQRYRSITDLERHLHANGTRIVKFFLHLSKEEQRKRFLARIDESDKNWKFSSADIKERGFWKQYKKAYEECLSATSTDDAPWYVVPADDKENARLIVSQIVLDRLEALKMSYPKMSAEHERELQSIRKTLTE